MALGIWTALQDALGRSPLVEAVLWMALLGLGAAVVAWLARRIALRAALRLPFATPEDRPTLEGIARRFAGAAAPFVVHQGVQAVPHLPPSGRAIVANLAAALLVLALARALAAGLDFANGLYTRREVARTRPIKGYLQVCKIGVYLAAAILMVAALIDRSPLILLSGLGAMAAVLMLVFRDTLLSLVASIQLSSNDMIRVGDWIEMPPLNANGVVVDIALHTVKVENFDKTVTAIPTHRLITESFKNWRTMSESGSRRIMRALLIDQNAVRFLGQDEIDDLGRFGLLQSYLAQKAGELAEWNARLPAKAAARVNQRRITNIGTFRAYVAAYLRAHPRVNGDLTQMVRQLEPTPAGLPLQIYCFTNTSVWAEYEAIQSDIFDHLIAILPEFGLRLFQKPSGLDLHEPTARFAMTARRRSEQAIA